MSSSQNKQSVTTNKKKMSFFNFGKSRASAPPESTAAPAKTEPAALAVDIADTEVNAAVLHSTKDDKPSSSARTQMRKFANFFKRSNAANSKKVVEQANSAAEDASFSATCPAESDQSQMEALQQKDALSLKEDGAKAEANATEVDLEVKKVKAATKIQAIFRGHNERRKYLKDKQNVVKVEALARGFLTRKNVAGMKGSLNEADTENEPSAEEVSSKPLVTSP